MDPATAALMKQMAEEDTAMYKSSRGIRDRKVGRCRLTLLAPRLTPLASALNPYYGPLSNFAFNCNLRHYSKAPEIYKPPPPGTGGLAKTSKQAAAVKGPKQEGTNDKHVESKDDAGRGQTRETRQRTTTTAGGGAAADGAGPSKQPKNSAASTPTAASAAASAAAAASDKRKRADKDASASASASAAAAAAAGAAAAAASAKGPTNSSAAVKQESSAAAAVDRYPRLPGWPAIMGDRFEHHLADVYVQNTKRQDLTPYPTPPPQHFSAYLSLFITTDILTETPPDPT